MCTMLLSDTVKSQVEARVTIPKIKSLGALQTETAGVCCGPCNPSKWEADMRSRGLLYCVSQEETSICTELADSMVTLGEPRDG